MGGAAATDVHTIEGALDRYEVDNGEYPTTAQGLAALSTNLGNLPSWSGPYLTKLPLDPWGHSYRYVLHPDAIPKVIISSDGPDGKPGGGDDIDNLPPKE